MKMKNQKNQKRTCLDVKPGKSISGEPSKSISGELSAESSEESAEDLESETETDTESTSEAETQSESNNCEELKKLHHMLLNVQKSMDDDKKGFFYAVYYGQKYFWGKVRKGFANDSMDDVNTVEFSLLRYRGNDMWDFPKQLDIEMVEIKYVFYGPCSPKVVTGKGYQISFDDIVNAQFWYKSMKAHNIYAKL